MSIFSAQIGSLVNNIFSNKGKESQPDNSSSFSFAEVMGTVSKENPREIIGSDGSALLNFHKKEEKVLTKVPKKGTKNIYDLIAEVERWGKEKR
jgi:hypothetical protein